MPGRKKIRKKGKINLSQYFQKIKDGSYVSVSIEKSLPFNLSSRIIGKTGRVIGKKGNACIVSIKDLGREKTYIINPVHLKKIKNDIK